VAFQLQRPTKTEGKKVVRELETGFCSSAEMIAVQKATWLSSRGNSLGERGKLEEAIQDFEEAIRIKNDHIPSYFSLGIAYEKKGMHEKARQIIEKASEEMKLNGQVIARKSELLQS
jgi:tetratricopeptide (TPR) repeat protein